MVNYQQGKIYKIVANGQTYIGSTCEPTLARRLAYHKSHYKSWMRSKVNYITSFRVLYEDNPEIVLIESYPCNSKDELIARERFYIESMVCVNKMMKKKEETSSFQILDYLVSFKQKLSTTNEKNDMQSISPNKIPPLTIPLITH